MKKLLTITASLTALFSYTNAYCDAYVVGASRIYAPYTQADEKGNVTGMDVDIMSAIAADQNFQVSFKPVSWNSLKNWKQEGVDLVIQGVARDEVASAMPGMTTSEYYLKSEDCVFALTEEKLNTWTQNKIATVLDDGLVEELTGRNIVAKAEQFMPVKTHFLGLKELVTGKADSVVGDCFALGYLTAHGAMNKVNFHSVMIPGSGDINGAQLVVGVDGNETELLKKINTGLENLKKSGELDRIINKWGS